VIVTVSRSIDELTMEFVLLAKNHFQLIDKTRCKK